MDSLPGAVIAALLGAGIAVLNYRLTKRAAGPDAPVGLFGAVPVIRVALSVGLLAAAYVLGPLTPWDRVWILAGAVVGLTVPLFFFTFLLVKQVNGSEGKTESRTENQKPDEPEDPEKKGRDRNG